MEDSTSSPGEVNSTAHLNKKRKLQNEPQEMPLSKHVCWNQIPKCDSSSNFHTELRKMESEKNSIEVESDPESAKDSNSLQCNTDSAMSTDEYETKTDVEYFNIHAYDESCTSCKIGVYSSESGSLAASSSTCTGRLDCSHYQYGQQNPSLDYEFGSEVDCSCLEYRNDGMENCADNEIEDLLYSNGIAPSNHVLSSGRWSVNQDTQQESKKLTIDKEFEQYFSMLMM